MLNKVMIIGRLGADPELKYATTGSAICNLSVATDESYTDQSGQRQERTEWHRVVVFNKQAENCANYLGKGSLVYVEGSLTTRKWTDQQGQTRYTTEIRGQRVQFLDRKGDRQGQGVPASDEGYAPRQQQQQPRNNQQDDDLGPAFPSEASGMDDVPF